MTENEAIKELETSINLAKMCTHNYERKREIQGYEMAINALEEVQQYRAIGTVEECRAAVERNNEKTRIIDGITECCGYDFGIDAFRIELSKFCPVCAGKLKGMVKNDISRIHELHDACFYVRLYANPSKRIYRNLDYFG